MVKIYDSIRDAEGNSVSGRVRLFISSTDEDGSIDQSTSGIGFVPQTNGTLFIVDDYVVNQLDKIQFINGELKVKDGETIDEPAKTQKQLMMEELERQLAELAAMPDEVLEGNVEPEEEEEEGEEEATEGE